MRKRSHQNIFLVWKCLNSQRTPNNISLTWTNLTNLENSQQRTGNVCGHNRIIFLSRKLTVTFPFHITSLFGFSRQKNPHSLWRISLWLTSAVANSAMSDTSLLVPVSKGVPSILHSFLKTKNVLCEHFTSPFSGNIPFFTEKKNPPPPNQCHSPQNRTWKGFVTRLGFMHWPQQKTICTEGCNVMGVFSNARWKSLVKRPQTTGHSAFWAEPPKILARTSEQCV